MNTIITSNSPLAVKEWSAALFKQALQNNYFQKFIGRGDDSMIQQKFDLTKDVGDQITFALRMNLTGSGIIDDNVIEGNEEALSFHNFSVQIHLRANGVKAGGKMTMRMSRINLKKEFKDSLADWLSEKVLEKDIICALSGLANGAGTIPANPPSQNRRWYGGQSLNGTIASVTGDSSIGDTQGHLFGPEVISVIKRKAQMATPKIRPCKVGGESLYLMFIHPYQAKTLKACQTWLNSQYYAANRGPENPIFKGASYLGIYDGVAIYEHDGIPRRNPGEQFEEGDMVSYYPVARALFCGAQAGVIGYGQYPGWYEKDFDYGRVPGVATDVIYGVGKTKFNNEDFAVITVDTLALAD